MTRWLRAARKAKVDLTVADNGTEPTQPTEPPVVEVSSIVSVLSDCPRALAGASLPPTDPAEALNDALDMAEEWAAISEHDGDESRDDAEAAALDAHAPTILAAIGAGAQFPGVVARDADLPGVRYPGTLSTRLLDLLAKRGVVIRGPMGKLTVVDQGGR